MRQIRLKHISDTYFYNAWRLYEDAFPIEERRLLDDQECIFKKDNYHFDVLIDKNQFIGFILWWDFDTCKYIEHFATSIEYRNRGLGKLILTKFIAGNDTDILLEVELPVSSMNKRRIQFYERIGFKLNQHYYEIPPVIKDASPLQLLLMSYPDFVSSKVVSHFIENYHPVIFKK